jgi:hypothetical protein
MMTSETSKHTEHVGIWAGLQFACLESEEAGVPDLGREMRRGSLGGTRSHLVTPRECGVLLKHHTISETENLGAFDAIPGPRGLLTNCRTPPGLS